MKVVILAGGFGTRISEESHLKPKPMIEIGGMPMLWHIMKYYSRYGYHEFIICCGYKQEVIKEWFNSYYLHNSDVTFDFTDGKKTKVHNNIAESWKVTLVDTGLHTMTGGRIKRIQEYIGEEPFMLTYGDGVCDVDLEKLVGFHKQKGKTATLTTVKVSQRFGVLDIDADTQQVKDFREKSENDSVRINGGFMVLQPEIFDYIAGDASVFEQECFEKLVQDGQLVAYKHNGFWQCMDTQREKEKLEEYWKSGKAPWKIW